MRSSFFLILSVFVHALAIAAIAISPSQISKPEGQEIEVQIGNAAETPGIESAPAGAPAPVAEVQAPLPAPVAPAPVPEPKPLKLAKSSMRKTRVEKAPMQKVTELPKKESVPQASTEQLDPQIEESVTTMPAPSAVAASDSDESTEATSEDAKAEDPTPAQEPAGKGEDSNSESETASAGTPANGAAAAQGGATQAGAVSYLDLKQNPGNKSPAYPLTARREARQGQVELLYRVTKDGKVADLQITKSSGHKDLDQEAARAVAQFKFVPGQEGWARHPVAFSLKGMASQAPSKLRNAQSDN